jgi:hypothetical protein
MLVQKSDHRNQLDTFLVVFLGFILLECLQCLLNHPLYCADKHKCRCCLRRQFFLEGVDERDQFGFELELNLDWQLLLVHSFVAHHNSFKLVRVLEGDLDFREGGLD